MANAADRYRCDIERAHLDGIVRACLQIPTARTISMGRCLGREFRHGNPLQHRKVCDRLLHCEEHVCVSLRCRRVTPRTSALDLLLRANFSVWSRIYEKLFLHFGNARRERRAALLTEEPAAGPRLIGLTERTDGPT